MLMKMIVCIFAHIRYESAMLFRKILERGVTFRLSIAVHAVSFSKPLKLIFEKPIDRSQGVCMLTTGVSLALW